VELNQNGNVADLTVRGAVALLASPPDSFASRAAEAEVDSLELAAANRAFAETEIRKGAYREIEAALKEIIDIGGNTSAIGQAVWDQLGSQLMTAIARCTETLQIDFEEPFALSLPATAAILDARDAAREMLRRIRAGAPS
jgi:hypothetical protein